MASTPRILLWASVRSEYHGGPGSLDIHAIEALPGRLRVAEASAAWDATINLLFLALVGVSGFLPLGLVQLYLPSRVPGWPDPYSALGFALSVATPLLGASAGLWVCFGSDSPVARFVLGGALKHSRHVLTLSVVEVARKRIPAAVVLPRWWTLRCRAGGESLTVTVMAREDRLRDALRLGGQNVVF